MEQLKLIGGGVVGGLVGAGIWAAIGHFTGYEVGWIAWGIGGLVGLGVKALGTVELAGFDRNTRTRVVRRVPAMDPAAAAGVAAVLALLSVAAGKYAVVELALSSAMSAPTGFEDAEVMIPALADEIVMERMEAGHEVRFPAGSDFESAAEQKDYPTEIWREAKARWDGMSADEREAYAGQRLAELRALFDEVGTIGRTAVFMSSFGLFDLLWFGLAASTAYKLGMSIGE